ncbi:MAG TPA: hypothetical protein VFH88_01020, partial [Candidatus Krumholzibacteria bacterium]|nr:hypothetical protein [Candidatus Krumholzibacteria bacterium]
MSSLALQYESARSARRTREGIAISTILHMALFLWLALHRVGAADTAGLTEISFVEQTDPAGLPDAAPPIAPKTTSSAPVQQVSLKASQDVDKPEHFERALVRAENAPSPQSSRAVTDLLDKRLDAIDKTGESTTRIASLVPAPNAGIPAP